MKSFVFYTCDSCVCHVLIDRCNQCGGRWSCTWKICDYKFSNLKFNQEKKQDKKENIQTFSNVTDTNNGVREYEHVVLLDTQVFRECVGTIAQ